MEFVAKLKLTWWETKKIVPVSVVGIRMVPFAVVRNPGSRVVPAVKPRV